jgi:hypothetical protein
MKIVKEKTFGEICGKPFMGDFIQHETPEARDGIGGHCLPKDIRYLTCIGNYTPLLMGAIETDTNYKNYLGRRENEQKSVVAYYFNIESSDSGDHL